MANLNAHPGVENIEQEQNGHNGGRKLDIAVAELNAKRLWFYKPFWVLGGGIPEILKNYPSEWNKYFGTGAAILMTSIFAGISGGYAISTIFKGAIIFPILFGLIWGLFIMTLDRYFVTSMHKTKENTFWNGLKVGWLRVLLAAFIGIIIARPLELRIAAPEIDIALTSQYEDQVQKIKNDFDAKEMEADTQKIDQNQRARFDAAIAGFIASKEELQGEINELQAIANEWAEKVNCECNGACGTMKRGRGPACRFNEERFAEAKRKLDDARRTNEKAIARLDVLIGAQQDSIKSRLATASKRIEAKKEEIRVDRAMELANLEESNRNSLINRNKVLAKLASEDSSVFWIIALLTALFIFLETAPILVKLIAPYGSYDEILDVLKKRNRDQAKLDRMISKEEIKLNQILLAQIVRAQNRILQDRVVRWEEDNRTHEHDQYEKGFSNPIYNDMDSVGTDNTSFHHEQSTQENRPNSGFTNPVFDDIDEPEIASEDYPETEDDRSDTGFTNPRFDNLG